MPERKIRIVSVTLTEPDPRLDWPTRHSVVKCHTNDGGRVDTWAMISYGEGMYWMFHDSAIGDLFYDLVLREYNKSLDAQGWCDWEWDDA